MKTNSKENILKQKIKIHCQYSQLAPPEKLVGHPKNPNKHSGSQIKALAKILEHTGWRNPIVVSKRSGYVIAGHGRLQAALLSKIQLVPVSEQDFENEAQEYAHMIADNKIAELAEMENSVISELISELGDDFDLELAGLLDENWDVSFGDDPDPDSVSDPDPIEPPEDPVTKPGDLWLLGEHRLLCGDCRSFDDLQRLFGDEKANLLLTDPPYNVDYTGKTAKALKVSNDSMDDEDFYQFLLDVFSGAFAFLKEGGVFYVWHADSEGYNFRKAVKDAGEQVRQCLVWVKNTMVMGRQDYQWKHEPCLYGWKKGAGHDWYSDRKQTTLLEFDRPSRSAEHPTMKPVSLFAYQIGNSSKKGDLIFDPFLGSGTSIIAAEQYQRKCYGTEISPAYCDVIVKRWQDLTGAKAKLDK